MSGASGELVNAPVEIDRDRWGRPLVVPPEGGKPVAYTRCTTYIDVLEDKYNLQKWMQRQVALGLSGRPDLQLAITAHRDDKKALDRICDEAREAAASSAAATTGTALHALTEQLDRGQTLPILSPEAQADLEAYQTAIQAAGLTPRHIERFCVQDPLKIGGTPDRVMTYQGTPYIADLKTGSIQYGMLKIAMQLAIYSRSRLYDPATGARDTHGADTGRGIVIHLPTGQAHCDLWWVDLETGWEAVKVATQVREQRRINFKALTEAFGEPARGSLRLEKRDQEKAAQKAEDTHQHLVDLIQACLTPDQVRDVWAAHHGEWDDQLTQVAKTHIDQLTHREAS